jgi:hypothetical protein
VQEKVFGSVQSGGKAKVRLENNISQREGENIGLMAKELCNK